MEWGRAPETDSGWVGAGSDDDLDERLAAEEAAAFDRGAPHVMTALGPINPAALGVTLCGECLLSGPDASSDDAADERHATLAALDDAYAAGVRALLAKGEPGVPVDLLAMRWLAERAPTHLIVPGTIAPGLGPDAAVNRLVADIRDGIAGTLIRAGAISPRWDAGNAAFDRDIEAAAAAQRRTGAPLLVGVADGEAAQAAARLEDAGVALQRVILVASARRWDEHALRSALERGACVALVDVLTDGWETAARHAALVMSLAGAGFGDRLVVGTGVARRAARRGDGGEPGWSGMVERFPLLLMEAGLDAIAVKALLVDNPRRALTIEPPAANEGTA